MEILTCSNRLKYHSPTMEILTCRNHLKCHSPSMAPAFSRLHNAHNLIIYLLDGSKGNKEQVRVNLPSHLFFIFLEHHIADTQHSKPRTQQCLISVLQLVEIR
jgi:hypothetical protein